MDTLNEFRLLEPVFIAFIDDAVRDVGSASNNLDLMSLFNPKFSHLKNASGWGVPLWKKVMG
jgi:hypothetical protein